MSDTFILELCLKTSSHSLKILAIRFEAGRHLYNCALGECLKRIRIIKDSCEWKKASKLPKSKERTDLFRKAIKDTQFNEYALHAFIKEHQKFFSDHIDAATSQKIASRAFSAANEYLKNKRGKPRFKGKNQFSSIESKSNLAGIRFCNGKIVWKDLELDIIYHLDDEVEIYGLQCPIKFVRLVKRDVKFKTKYYAQLVLEGKPLIKKKHVIAKGSVVGLDIGPSTIAVVSEKMAYLGVFCDELKTQQEKKKTKQKKLCHKREVFPKKSNRYQKLRAEIAEMERIIKATRQMLHGKLCNKILGWGTIIKTEKLSYKGFQKVFGKSIQIRAPGMLIEKLARKAANAGGKLIEFSPWKTKLSSRCHHCDKIKTKPLSLRHHACDCGLPSIQRDLYSAFLAKHVSDDGNFDRHQALEAWTSEGPLLERALSRCRETMSGKLKLSSLGLDLPRQSSTPVKDRSTQIEVLEVQKAQAFESPKRGLWHCC